MENKPKIPHIPVMLAEVTEHMSPNRHGIVFVDCTLGYGGHSVAIAETFDKSDTLIGMDRDVEAIQFCEKLFQEASFHFSAVHQGFEELELFMEENAIEGADYFLFDLGFSSPQVDRGERGFSFMREGPLDMRMDRRQPQSAKDILATWSEDRLAQVFKIYGDERFSRRIAKAIARRRDEEPIETTQELADIILNAIPAKYQHQEGIHPATRVFQALRIVVNDELEALKKGLDAALNYLNHGGRVGVISYHSLEHRIVKQQYRDFCGRCVCPPGLPKCGCGAKARGTVITKKPVKPCAAEIDRNPRSRSAQLRVLERFPQNAD